MRLFHPFFVFFVPVTASGVLPCFAEGDDQPLVVNPAVATVIEGIIPTVPLKPLRKIVYQNTVTPAGFTTNGSSTYEPIGANLWGLNTVRIEKNGTIHTRTISLCGLVELVSASTSISQFENFVPVPIGHIFIPMGMHITKEFSSQSRAVSLSMGEGSANLCAPQAGNSFSYSTNSETTLSNTPSGRPKILSSAFDWQCSAGAITTPGPLEAVWPGEYIPVTCKSANYATGKPIISNYAYIVDSAIYLKLGSINDAFQLNTKYSALETDAR